MPLRLSPFFAVRTHKICPRAAQPKNWHSCVCIVLMLPFAKQNTFSIESTTMTTTITTIITVAATTTTTTQTPLSNANAEC